MRDYLLHGHLPFAVDLTQHSLYVRKKEQEEIFLVNSRPLAYSFMVTKNAKLKCTGQNSVYVAPLVCPHKSDYRVRVGLKARYLRGMGQMGLAAVASAWPHFFFLFSTCKYNLVKSEGRKKLFLSRPTHANESCFA